MYTSVFKSFSTINWSNLIFYLIIIKYLVIWYYLLIEYIAATAKKAERSQEILIIKNNPKKKIKMLLVLLKSKKRKRDILFCEWLFNKNMINIFIIIDESKRMIITSISNNLKQISVQYFRV